MNIKNEITINNNNYYCKTFAYKIQAEVTQPIQSVMDCT